MKTEGGKVNLKPLHLVSSKLVNIVLRMKLIWVKGSTIVAGIPSVSNTSGKIEMGTLGGSTILVEKDVFKSSGASKS